MNASQSWTLGLQKSLGKSSTLVIVQQEVVCIRLSTLTLRTSEPGMLSTCNGGFSVMHSTLLAVSR